MLAREHLTLPIPGVAAGRVLAAIVEEIARLSWSPAAIAGVVAASFADHARFSG
jgi:hypothetical protein